ncbi:MAG: aminoglycoside phosphotransferase family protein [Planctomycetes bacterium]|nr:aminoglycoside phosphotransferase family protein [Planctomycetota bacterium]
MTRLLPVFTTEADYARLRWTSGAWAPALEALCVRHDLDPTSFVRAGDGTHVVYLGPGVVLKLFVHLWADDAARERAALRAIDGRLPVPRVLAEGDLEGWPYVLIERLPGIAIKHVWADLDRTDQEALAEEVGAFARRLHDEVAPGQGWAQPTWDDFIADRRARCLEHHARRGATREWLERIEAWLAGLPPVAPTDLRPRLLHADLTHDHLLVEQVDGRWRLRGVIDWADAQAGDPLYDLAVLAVFLAQGRSTVGRALRRGYGLPDDEATARRLLEHALLHRFGHIAGILRLAHGPQAQDLAALQAALWGA